MQFFTRFGLLAPVLVLSLACDDGSPAVSGGSGGATSGMGGNGNLVAAGTAGEGGMAATAGAPVCGSVAPEDGFSDVSASDPGIRYVGRLDFADPEAPRMSFPAITIETRFVGDAIDLRLEESAPGGPSGTAYYEVVVDAWAPIKLETCTQQSVYPLARDLDEGMHTVRIAKRTEGQVGAATFRGFRVRPGTSLASPDAPPRRLEVVGDSITCGYGNEISTTTPDNYHFTSTNENALLAYGAVAARALDADYVAVAASGRGLVRNYSGGAGSTAPTFYDLTAADASGNPWDHERYSPDVIVVNLGTNDFSIGLNAEQLATVRESFRQTYADFLSHIRSVHSGSTLIAAVGPMISDFYPADYQALASVRSDIRGVVDARTATGDANVYYLEFAGQASPYGEDWHPTIATHQQMADALAAFIRQKKGWQ